MRNHKITKVYDKTISTGNNAVAVCCEIEGREGKWLMKCYFRHKPNLQAIYRDGYYPQELGIYSFGGGIDYIDAVITPWIEGTPLDDYIGAYNSDYATLSHEFDKLAKHILNAPYAHGDIKPENIIVTDSNTMKLIDLDASWLPEFSYKDNCELGTNMYRHPQRKAHFFNKHIDDYPCAIISTTLAALALDRATMEPHITLDKTLFDPELCIKRDDAVLEAAKRILLKHNDITHYCIAEALHSATPAIYNIRDLFDYLFMPISDTIPEGATVSRCGAKWGYMLNGEWIIPPIYDKCHRAESGIAKASVGRKRIKLKVDNDAPIIRYNVTDPSSVIDYDSLVESQQQAPTTRRRRKRYLEPNRRGKHWSDGEDLILKTHTSFGHSVRGIAKYIGRSEKAVRARLTRLNIPIPEHHKPLKP